MEDLRLSPQEKGVTKDIFAGIFAGLMEAVHIELPDEAVNVPMPEIFREDMVLKLIDFFDGELTSVGHPMYNGLILLIFEDVETLLDEVSH